MGSDATRKRRTRLLAAAIIVVALGGLAEAVTRAATFAAWTWGLDRHPRIAERFAASRDVPLWDVALLFAPPDDRPAPQAGVGPAPTWTRWRDLPSSAFKTPLVAGPAAPGVVRVACIGDSTTWSGYPEEMGRILDARFGPGRVEVVNLGVSAADLPAVRLLAQRFLPGWHPDLVVAYLGRNDLVFDVARARVERAEEIGLAPTPALAFRTAPRMRGLRDLACAPTDPDPLAAPAHRADVDRRVDARLRQTLRDLVATVHALPARAILSTLAAPGGEISPGERDLHEAEIRYLWPTLGSLDEYLGRVDAFNRAVRDVAAEAGVPVIDVASALPRRPGIFLDICHLEGDGVAAHARIAADALAPAIEALLRERAPAPSL